MVFARKNPIVFAEQRCDKLQMVGFPHLQYLSLQKGHQQRWNHHASRAPKHPQGSSGGLQTQGPIGFHLRRSRFLGFTWRYHGDRVNETGHRLLIDLFDIAGIDKCI